MECMVDYVRERYRRSRIVCNAGEANAVSHEALTGGDEDTPTINDDLNCDLLSPPTAASDAYR